MPLVDSARRRFYLRRAGERHRVGRDAAVRGRQRKVLRFIAVGDGYWGALAGAFATVFDVPGPVTGAGAQPHGWPAAVFFSVFIPLLTVFPFIFTGLVVYGLRGNDPQRA